MEPAPQHYSPPDSNPSETDIPTLSHGDASLDRGFFENKQSDGEGLFQPHISREGQSMEPPDGRELDAMPAKTTDQAPEPHPDTSVGKVAKVAVEAMSKKHTGPSDWSLIVQSAAAGAVSFIVALPTCELASHQFQVFSQPTWNALLGVVASTATYVPTFIAMSLYRARDQLCECDGPQRNQLIKDKIIHGLKFLSLQEACEYAARYSLHVGLMVAGLPAWSAFAVASTVTGLLGRLATPWFSRMFKKREQ